MSAKPELSIIVPLYNEQAGLAQFHASLIEILKTLKLSGYEILYIDDGSTDGTAELATRWHRQNSKVKVISFSRNFGKESALSAGITMAQGDAILTIDGDSQHPVELIPDFLKRWRAGSRVVIGLRLNASGDNFLKRLGARLFYLMFNRLTGQTLLAGSTDFRLIDSSVQEAFLTLKESGRVTRGLIDWLGFQPSYIEFRAKKRAGGKPGYSFGKLFKLAADSFASLTPRPLYFFGYLGVFITAASLVLGLAVIIEQLILSDPLNWNFTGTAMLGILVTFLVGIVLMSQGILSLYISHIHAQTKRRPLYIIDYKKSAGINT